MAIVSKPFFYSKITPQVTCRHIVHEDLESCIKANLILSLSHFGLGVFSFYLPVYIIKLLIDYKKIDKNYLKKFVISYVRSECFGVGFGTLVLNTICLSCNVLGRLHYNAVSFLPGFVAGLSLLFEDDKNKVLNAVLWASLVIEAFFKNVYYFQMIKYTPLRETILFMLTSSILMYLLKKMKSNKEIPTNLWFYFPSLRKDYYSVFSLHNYTTKILKHFGIGLGLSSARTIANGLTKLHKISIRDLLKPIFSKNNFKFGILLGGYVATFEILMHLLKKYNDHDATNAAIAGFVAGTCYYVKPTTNLLTIGIVTTLQILFKDISSAQNYRKIQLSVLVYMICNGILLKNRLMASNTCPKYYSNMTSIGSSGLIDKIYFTLVKKYLQDINVPH